MAPRIGPAARTIRYGVTRHRVTLAAHLAAPIGGSPSPGPGLSGVDWLGPAALDALARTGATRRLSSWAAAHPDWLGSARPEGI